MLGWIVNKKLASFEREFDYDMSYARDLYGASPRAFWKFTRILPMSEYREGAPLDAWYAAKIVATLSEDCGPALQLVVTMAERQGVKPETLRAILAGDASRMPADATLGFRFAKAVLAHDIPESDRLRTEIVDRWGRKALASLALGIASSRVYPNLKYALGYGHACVRVQVAGTDAPLGRSQSAGAMHA